MIRYTLGMRTLNLSGKTALITGGTRNIGRAIAQTLAEAGADVALFYLNDEAAASRAREEIQASTGRRAEVYRMDVSQEAAVELGVERALADFGGSFSILVHNAGHGPVGMMPDIHTDQWRATLAVNLDAAFFLTRALLRREGALPFGNSVVFISSGRGHGAAPGLSPYGTAKAALNHFAAMLAQDVGPRGVRVNVVSPSYVETADTGATEEERRTAAANTALRRLGRPADVAEVVLFFASDLSAFVTGQCLQVNGGG
jgi:3-oxoacyl-[acyl-carrier protein] reductase